LGKFVAITGQTVLMAGMTFARADLEKYLKDGRHLNKEEIAQIAVQGIIMAIAMHAIAPKFKPLFADLEASSYTFATKLRASNSEQGVLAAKAEALKGTRDLKPAQDYIAEERKWVEERLALLDEITAQAAKEKPGAKDSLAAKLKLTPDQIKD